MSVNKEQRDRLNVLIMGLSTPRCRYSSDFCFVLNGNELRIICKTEISGTVLMGAFTGGFEVISVHEF